MCVCVCLCVCVCVCVYVCVCVCVMYLVGVRRYLHLPVVQHRERAHYQRGRVAHGLLAHGLLMISCACYWPGLVPRASHWLCDELRQVGNDEREDGERLAQTHVVR